MSSTSTVGTGVAATTGGGDARAIFVPGRRVEDVPAMVGPIERGAP